MRQIKLNKLVVALGTIGVVLTSAILIGCNTKAKQEAMLAIEAAKLSIADASKVKLSSAANRFAIEAKGNLRKAENFNTKKDYVKAKNQAELASANAKKAIEEAQKAPPVVKKTPVETKKDSSKKPSAPSKPKKF